MKFDLDYGILIHVCLDVLSKFGTKVDDFDCSFY